MFNLLSHSLNRKNGDLLYSAASNLQDRSKRFTLYFLADLFDQTTSQLLWKTHKHTAINARRLFLHKYPPHCKTKYSCIQLSELEQRRVNELANGSTRQHNIRTRVLLVERPQLQSLSYSALTWLDEAKGAQYTYCCIFSSYHIHNVKTPVLCPIDY